MNLQKIISEEVSQYEDITQYPFVKDIYQNGGKVYYVGGYVRDSFIGKESKDIDILVTGIPMNKLEQILNKSGRVDLVGQSFGILKFIPTGTKLDLDIAIPRVEQNTGDKYTDFEVKSDHNLPIEADLKRRDFTINAIAKDITGKIVDPYGGVQDLKNKVIRMVNPEAFSDDPLRMIRAIQFASRFNFSIEPDTFKAIKDNAPKIKNITAERILIEFDKIIKKGSPEKGIKDLIDTNLYKNIFEVEPKINNSLNIGNIKTMGEFIFCLLYDRYVDVSTYFKGKMKGDIESTNQIKCLENIMDSYNNNELNNKILFFNSYKISPIIFETSILPNNILKQIESFKKYPKTFKELDINGNDIMGLGYKGAEVGDIQKKILINILDDKLSNKKNEIINFIKNV
jgi:tRNA nucleotidyltransferase/poly(A) polymerase